MIGSLNGFKASAIENDLYDLMDNHLIGVDLYDAEVINEITKCFQQHKSLEWQLECVPWPDNTGGVCAVAFLDGNLRLITFDYGKGE